MLIFEIKISASKLVDEFPVKSSLFEQAFESRFRVVRPLESIFHFTIKNVKFVANRFPKDSNRESQV